MIKPILMVTRPIESAQGFVKAVKSQAKSPFQTVNSPALRIDPIDVPEIGQVDTLVLTSSNGVKRAAEIGLCPVECFCVGEKTTKLAQNLGLGAKLAGHDAEALVQTLMEVRPSGQIVHLSGQHTRGAVVERLKSVGLNARRVIAYHQKILEPTAEAKGAFMGTIPVVLPMFSPRSAALVIKQPINAPLHVIAMSDAVREVLPQGFGSTIKVVDHPDEDHMVSSTAQVLSEIVQ